MKQRNCPLCGCEITHKIEAIKMILPKEYCLPQEYDIVSCSQCGFCYADTKATLEDYNHYYQQCNVYSGMPVDESAWDKLHCEVSKLMEDRLSKSDSLLDMGFGQGHFLRWLKQNGYNNITGIDPSNASVENVRKDGISAFMGSVFEIPGKEYTEQFDCVFLFDVLEHLLFPKDAIHNVSWYLRKDGYLVISVPNYNCLKWNHNPITNMFNQEHINYFSEVSLDNIMEMAGFVRIATNAEREGEEDEIIAMYQLTREKNSSSGKDNKCRYEIKEYIQKFETRRIGIEEKLSVLAKCEEKELYVWGTGAFTMWLLANTILAQFDIIFIDNNKVKAGQRFWKGIIKTPEDIVDSRIPILICSMLYSEQIQQQIHAMGLKNDIIIV